MSNIEEKDDSRLVLSKKMIESTKYWKAVIDGLTRRIREDDLRKISDIQAKL